MKKIVLERKKVSFKFRQKKLRSARSSRGKEFQMVGAANEKERRPIADLMLGTESKCCVLDRRARDGV